MRFCNISHPESLEFLSHTPIILFRIIPGLQFQVPFVLFRHHRRRPRSLSAAELGSNWKYGTIISGSLRIELFSLPGTGGAVIRLIWKCPPAASAVVAAVTINVEAAVTFRCLS